MRVRKITNVIYSICLAQFVSGCILPIPHKRVSVVGCEGIVCDADTGTPIMGALVSVMYSGKTENVFTDEQGRYKVDEEMSWHGAYFIGIPVSFSLFPTLDAPLFPCAISVSVDGYAPWRWQSWIDLNAETNCLDSTSSSDPTRIRVKRLGASGDPDLIYRIENRR